MSQARAAVHPAVHPGPAAGPVPDGPVLAPTKKRLIGLAAAAHVAPAPPLAPRDLADDDAAGALTAWLVHDLAPMLGLDPASVRIQAGGAAAMRLAAASASGLATPEHIELHPRRFQPGTVAGRYLLAHELVHTAQRTLPAILPPPLARRAAEEEAHRLGHAYATGHAVHRPRVGLPVDAIAADTGPPTLAESILASRAREIAAIKGYLSGWWISDGDVASIMEILDSVAWPVARAILMALTAKERYQLADNINAPHVAPHQRSVLAAYATLPSGEVDAVDLDVVRAFQPGYMGSEEKDAASNLMRNLGGKVRMRLLRDDRDGRMHSLMRLAAPSEAERDRMDAEVRQAALEEAALAGQRSALVALENDTPLNDTLDQVRALLAPRTGPAGTHTPNGGDALAVLDLLAAVRGDVNRLAYIGERMEQAGLIDLLLRLLPPARLADTTAHVQTIVALVRARLPFKNTRLIDDLLSYGLFDWAITDEDALFAYNLIKSLPLLEQLRFKRRDAGKWYMRLLDNLPRGAGGRRLPGLEIRSADNADDIARLQQEGITVDPATLLYNASEVYARKLQEDGATSTLAALIAAFEQARKGVYRDQEARDLYARLVALGGSSLATGQEHPADRLLRDAVVRELDALGYIDELFGELPEAFLYAEDNRVATVKLMLARDPARVQRHARDLVSRGVTDWMVKDHEAWLAFMCVKALPATEREDFIAVHADLWSRIQGEMSRAQRAATDLNAYIGDQAGVDRASVLGQLADDALWDTRHLQTLAGLLHMAVAMTEHRFAFARSEEFRAVERPGLAGLVEQYRLWNPAAGRTQYTPALLQGTRWHEEGPFATLRTLGNAAVALWNMDLLYVDGKVGARVDLNDVQGAAGGDLAGAHLATPPRGKAPPDTNRLTVLVGADGKSAELILPELLIDTANVQFGGTTFQTGAITLKDLRLHASYNARDLGQPTQAHAILGSVVVADMLLASSGSMLAVARLGLQALRVASGAIDTITGAHTANRKPGALPFPLLVIPLLALLMTFAVPVYLYRRITGYAEKFPNAVAPRTKALDFSFASLSADGVTTSGGQQIGRVAVTDMAVHTGATRTTRLRAERASIDQRLAHGQQTPELVARRQAIDREIAAADADEKTYLAIQERILAGGVPAAEQARLQQQLDRLKFDEQAGTYIDIGAIEALGVAGTVTAREPIRLSGIHGEGGAHAVADMVTITDAELAQRAGAGVRPPAPGSAGQPGGLHLELGDVATGAIAVGGGLRTVASIDAQLASLQAQKEAPQLAPLVESLFLLRAKAVRFEQLVQHGVSSLDGRQLDEFRSLRRELVAQADLMVQSIAMTRLTLDVDIATGRVAMGAGTVDIAGIQMPGQGIEVDQVIARGLGVGALPAGGLLNWAEWKKNLRDAEGKVDALEVSGVRSRMHGLLFEKATLTGAYAGLKDRNEVKAGLARLRVTGMGVVPRLGLLRQRLAGLQEKYKVATGTERARTGAEITTLSARVAELDQFVQARVAAYSGLAAAQAPAEVAAAKQAVAEVDMTIILGVAQYGAAIAELDDFGVQATGAGDLLGDFLDGGASRVLEHGVRVAGAGPHGRVLKRFAVRGANTRADTADASLLAGGNMELGETRLDASVRRQGDTATIDLAAFDIAGFTLSELLLTTDTAGAGLQVGSTGASSIEGVHLDGAATLVKRAGVRGDGAFPSDFRLAQVVIHSLRIDAVRGNGLVYRSIPEKIEATVQSGVIGGIWMKDVTLTYPENGARPVILGAAGIDSITDLELAGAVVDGWAARGRINGRDLRVDFLEDGALHASVGDLSAGSVALRGPDGWARLSVNHLSGAVQIKDGVVTVEQFKLGSIEVPAVHWRAGTRTIDGDRPARLIDLRVRANIHLRQGDDTGKGPVKSVSVDELYVGAVAADHLVYRDGVNEVEIGTSSTVPATLPAEMHDYRPLYIADIRVRNLEWDPVKGIGGKRLEGEVGHYEAAAVYRSLVDDVRGGLAIKGDNMGLSFIGPNFIVGSTGVIEKTGGFYRDKHVNTTFSTGKIFSSVTLTDKGVTINAVEVDQIALGHTKYAAPGMEVELGGAGAEHLTVGRIDVTLAKGVDAGGKPVNHVSDVTVDEVVLSGLHADAFHYTGKAVSTNASGETVTGETDVRAERAWIDRFTVECLTHNVAARLTTVARAAVDSRSSAHPAFGVQGLVGQITSAVGNRQTAVRFATDIEGDALHGQNLSFQTIKLGSRMAGDKAVDVTRNAIGGKFQLDRVALVNPSVTLTDSKGRQTSVRGAGGPNGARITLSGFTPTLYPNGTMVLPFAALTAENFLITHGGMKLTVPLLQLKDFAVALKGLGTAEGLKLLAARLARISVHDVQFEMEIDRSKPDDKEPAPPPAPGAKKTPLFGEPLDNLTGAVRIEYDHPLAPGATLHLVERNRSPEDIDTFSVELDGIHVRLNRLRRLIEFVLNHQEGADAAPAQPDEDKNKPADLSKLDKVLAQGHLRLGNGRVGVDTNASGIPDAGDAFADLEAEDANDNRIDIPRSRVGRELKVNVPRLRARRLSIPAGDAYPAGSTGEATVTGIKVRVTGLATMAFTIRVTATEGKIVDIEFGDLTVFQQDAAGAYPALQALPSPTLDQVSPAAAPAPEPAPQPAAVAP